MNLIREEIDRIKNLMTVNLLSETASASQKQQALLQIIRQAEHSEKNWDKAYYTIYGSKQVAPPVHNKRLDQMTLAQWLLGKDSDGVKFPYKVDQFNSRASGAYQFMPKTLRGLRSNGWVSDGDVMSKQKQDSIVLKWLKSNGIGIDIDNLPNELNIDITDRLALKWAAIPSSKHGGGSAMENQSSKKWSTINKWYTSLIGTTQTVFNPYDSDSDSGVNPNTNVDPNSLIVTPDNEYYYPEIDSEEDESIGPIDITDILEGNDVLKKGDESNLISDIQNLLVYDYDYDLGDSGDDNDGTDGAFGKKTEKAIKEFQKKNGIPDDGIIGLCTLDAILEGHTHYCCKEDHCEEDECKKSKWCNDKPTPKKRTKKSTTKKEKTDKSDKVDIDNVTPSEGLPGNFAEIPGGQGNFRCEQPTLKELAKVFEDYPDIERVVRMNGDEGGLSQKDEKRYVDSTGREYIWFNAHNPRSAKNSYTLQFTPGYYGAVELGLAELNKGNTLIHCTHGADRTGFIVAAYIKEKLGWSNEKLWEYTVAFNGWDGGYEGCCTNAKYKS